jgi:hypothetical protein
MRTTDFEKFDSLELSQLEASEVEGGDIGIITWILGELADFHVAYQAAQAKCCK